MAAKPRKYQIMNPITTPEQAVRLIACGIHPNTADLSYISCYNGWISAKPYKIQTYPGKLPFWSLTALLNLLKDYEPSIEWIDGKWECRLQSTTALRWPHGNLFRCADDPIEACVLVFERLKEFGYEINNTQDEES